MIVVKPLTKISGEGGEWTKKVVGDRINKLVEADFFAAFITVITVIKPTATFRKANSKN